MPYAFPPAAPTVSGDNLTASRFLNSTPLVARRLRTLAEQRFVALTLLTQRASTTSGSLQLETSEGLYADRAVEVVSPGGEYPMTTLTSGPIQQVSTQKWGQDTRFTDEAISRFAMPVVERGLVKLVNTAAKNIDGIALSLVASAVTQTQGTAGTSNWTGANPTILRDIMVAKAAIQALNQGYEPNALLVNDATWAAIASDPTLINTMQRETSANPVYSGELNLIAGVRILPTPNLPSAGGWLVDTNALGGILTEVHGQAYQSAGDLLQTKTWREDPNDQWRVRVRSIFAPYIVEPNAAIKINNAI